MLVSLAKQEMLRKCNCRPTTIAYTTKPEEFEAEMNLSCPAHGFRRLGWIVLLGDAGPEGAKLRQLVELYQERLKPKYQLRDAGR